MNRLKSCPFCGSNSATVGLNDYNKFEAYCPHCYASSAPSNSNEGAIQNWNKRPDKKATKQTNHVFQIGDKVQILAGVYANRIDTITWMTKTKIYLDEITSDYFSPNDLKLVQKCPFKEGDVVNLKAVYWNDYDNCFDIKDVTGTFNSRGIINFEKETFCYNSIPYAKIDKIRTNKVTYTDAVFCLPEDIKKAMLVCKRSMHQKVRDLEDSLSRLKYSQSILEQSLIGTI